MKNRGNRSAFGVSFAPHCSLTQCGNQASANPPPRSVRNGRARRRETPVPLYPPYPPCVFIREIRVSKRLSEVASFGPVRRDDNLQRLRARPRRQFDRLGGLLQWKPVRDQLARVQSS